MISYSARKMPNQADKPVAQGGLAVRFGNSQCSSSSLSRSTPAAKGLPPTFNDELGSNDEPWERPIIE
jgi:hypothetical protein